MRRGKRKLKSSAKVIATTAASIIFQTDPELCSLARRSGEE